MSAGQWSGTVAARPTTYKGITMRSRLEAAFAQRLDNIDTVSWRYEPQAFADETGQYLPDFLLCMRGDLRMWVECKPDSADLAEALRRMHVIVASEPDANLYVACGKWLPNGDTTYAFDWGPSCTIDDPCGSCSRRKKPKGTVRFDAPGEMLCPCCGHNFTHLQHVNQVESYDPSRLDVELVFECEHGCDFGVRVRQHKGFTYMEYVEAPASESP